MVHDAARPFVTKELVDIVLNAAKASDAAVCGAPCSDTLKEVAEDGLVVRTVDRSRLWTVQTPQIFRTRLLRECYRAALASGETFTDDTAVVEKMGHPVRIVLYHGINLKVTTPADWAVAEALMHTGEGDNSPGMQLRKQLHDMNNHLTPLLGYAYLLVNESEEGSRAKKFAKSIQGARRALPGNDGDDPEAGKGDFPAQGGVVRGQRVKRKRAKGQSLPNNPFPFALCPFPFCARPLRFRTMHGLELLHDSRGGDAHCGRGHDPVPSLQGSRWRWGTSSRA